MEYPKNLKIALYLLLTIYLIAALQHLVIDGTYLASISKMAYGDKVDRLNKQYYKHEFYKYAVWVNKVLPRDVSFSVYFKKGTEIGLYKKYLHKFNYYMYPRYVLIPGLIQPKAWPPDEVPRSYTDVVMLLNVKDVGLRSRSGLRYAIIDGKTYYVVSRLDEKALLAEKNFVRTKVVGQKNWESLNKDFISLYGFSMKKAAF